MNEDDEIGDWRIAQPTPRENHFSFGWVAGIVLLGAVYVFGLWSRGSL